MTHFQAGKTETNYLCRNKEVLKLHLIYNLDQQLIHSSIDIRAKIRAWKALSFIFQDHTHTHVSRLCTCVTFVISQICNDSRYESCPVCIGLQELPR